MPTARENLADWLRDAYAMEVQAAQMMENMLARLEHYPELEARLRQHVEETNRQADRVRECLQRLGTDTSVLKTTVGAFTGTMQALSGVAATDEVVKGGVFSHAFEQWEIANYTVLIATAEAAGEMEIRATLESILREEEAMAGWLRQHLPVLARRYIETGEKR